MYNRMNYFPKLSTDNVTSLGRKKKKLEKKKSRFTSQKLLFAYNKSLFPPLQLF